MEPPWVPPLLVTHCGAWQSLSFLTSPAPFPPSLSRGAAAKAQTFLDAQGAAMAGTSWPRGWGQGEMD